VVVSQRTDRVYRVIQDLRGDRVRELLEDAEQRKELLTDLRSDRIGQVIGASWDAADLIEALTKGPVSHG
jgi:hypothetical protein